MFFFFFFCFFACVSLQENKTELPPPPPNWAEWNVFKHQRKGKNKAPWMVLPIISSFGEHFLGLLMFGFLPWWPDRHVVFRALCVTGGPHLFPFTLLRLTDAGSFTNWRFVAALTRADLSVPSSCLCHILVISAIFQSFPLSFVMVTCDQWSWMLLLQKKK